jgi:glycosyltransferase involved in cell wall biosynthesis
MRLGVVIEETWDFLHEIYADLQAHHQTSLYARPARVHLPVFDGRVNGYRFRKSLRDFTAGHDVVFFEWASELLLEVSRMPKTCGIVTRLHRYELYEFAPRINWDAVDRVILVSDAKMREFAAAFPAHAHKTVMIPEAVSLTRFRATPKAFNGDIGILCHLKPRKRVYDLVLTFKELVDRRPGFHLHVGGGLATGFEDYYVSLHQLVDRLGLRDKVTFYGHQAKPEEWYPKVDVFISNGYSEGLQVAPMEAVASGCYCFSHHWDGADEFFPPENLYYTSGQLQERLLAYADAGDAARQAARERLRAILASRFDVDETKVRVRRVIEEAAAAPGGRASRGTA